MQTMQNMIPCNLALLAIATLFYSWRDAYRHRAHSHALAIAKRRQRIAHLLWAAANCDSRETAVNEAAPA